MPIQLECPGCKATLYVADELAGKQGKCIQCGHRIVVPGGKPGTPGPPAGGSPPAAASGAPTNKASVSGIGSTTAPSTGGGIGPTLFEATPEAMMRELYRRQASALLLIFQPDSDGSYDLSTIPDSEIKCIATEDINQARFAQVVAGFTKKFGPRQKKSGGSSATLSAEELLYQLKGDKLGMQLEEFKTKYGRQGDGGQRLPLCSDTAWGANKATLQSEPWHRQANIINARIDLPAEDNSPTVAGVKTELLLYQFIDCRLFRIAAFLPTDQFHLVSEAAINKYGPVTRETQKPRQLVWENPLASVVLTRGNVHPREPSMLELIHKQLAELAASRTPSAASDI
jgi:hypothetical protein